MRQSHLVLSNAAIMWAARVLLLVPQLVLVPFLIHTIGDAGYGVYVLIWSLMVSIDQVQNALQSGVVKYSAAFLMKQDIEEVNKVVSSSFVYSLLLGVLACACSLFAAGFYNDPSGKVASSLIVVGVTILLTIPLTPYVAVIQSRQRYYVGAVAETVSKYVSLLAVFLWFRAVGPSVEAPIIIMAGMLFLSRLAQVPVAYRLVPGLHNHPRSFGWQSFRLITSFGFVVILLALCMVANSTGVRWMMGALVSTTFVAHLAIILMPALLLTQVVEAVTITVMPATSGYEAAGNRKMLQELLLRGTRYTVIIVLAGLLAAGLLMRVAFVLWVGPEYAFLAPYALVLFASVSFMLSASTAHHMLKGLGKLWSVLFVYLIGLVIVPISSILAVFAVTHNPYVAVTAGLALGHLLCGVLQIRLGFRTVHINARDPVLRGYAQPLVVAGVVCALAVGATAHFNIEGVAGRMAVSVLAVLLFLAGIYAFIASVEERRQFKELLQVALKRVVRT